MATANPGAVFTPEPNTVSDALSLDQILAHGSRNESYAQLVWRRFQRSTVSIIGGLIVLMLAVLAIFAEFFSPTPINGINGFDLKSAFISPQQVHLVDATGQLHLTPFVYGLIQTLNPKTFQVTWTEDTKNIYPIHFFVHSWPYKVLGIIPTDLHLFGVDKGGSLFMLGTDKQGRDLWGKACEAGRVSLAMSLFGTLISIAVGSVMGVVSGYYGGRIDDAIQRFVEFVTAFPQLPLWMALAVLVPKTADSFAVFVVIACIFALLSWTTLAREVRGKVLALRQTDFVLAAKEMGASDARIIFRHLYPNTLSHVIVVLTLTIPGIILAEAFLSFLGVGIKEPLTSWGLLMQNAQNLQTLSQQLWIMTPTIFIILAVLGFNLLGDGLRDAADPYAGR